MKRIIKMGPPRELRQWFENQPIENGQRINCSYSDIPGEVKLIVKQQLIKEQGGLCCYTGIRVTDQKSHIEHFKPQLRCKEDGNNEDVCYDNLFVAYPGENKPCSFGAIAKGDWYDESLLINPLRSDCENRFKFNLSGQIKPSNDQHLPTLKTIEKLHLDDDLLTDFRKQAIEEALFSKKKPLSSAKLQQIIQSYCDRNANQLFKPFCFVIIHAARELLHKAERKRRSKQFSRQQRQK